eukprot:CAMPEP_0178412544 /NCGR_PEP_ID=MMETSP0689_2-20121128/22069_1 /TAXON_ID=160604 /ORGANISM="Amphidinium massartii, Strain CS-259" /LENGTH=301 /DNA_ID=CAMNT_0020033793 /DNA_START=226 /DNA_END=1127 /DNA_ORIENTATION=+
MRMSSIAAVQAPRWRCSIVLIAALLRGACALRPLNFDDSWTKPMRTLLQPAMGALVDMILNVTRDVNSTISLLDESTHDDLVIVGNGPLLDEQRQEIAKFPASRVFRMNAMNTLRDGEPVGHVFANACSQGWWGVTVLACPMLNNAEEILLFGEAEKAQNQLPSLRQTWGSKVALGPSDGHHVTVEGHQYNTTFPNGGFSIGFKGVSYVRARYPNARLHVYGMNWSPPKNQRPHPFDVENKAIAAFSNVEIHPSPVSEHWHGDQDHVCVAGVKTKAKSSFLEMGVALNTSSSTLSQQDIFA